MANEAESYIEIATTFHPPHNMHLVLFTMPDGSQYGVPPVEAIELATTIVQCATAAVDADDMRGRLN